MSYNGAGMNRSPKKWYGDGIQRIKRAGSAVGTMEVDAWALDATSKKSKRSGAHWGDRTQCSAGHEYTEATEDKSASYSWRIDPKRGTPIRRCLECERATKKKSRQNRSDDARDSIRQRDAQWKRDKRAALKLGLTVAQYRAQVGDTAIVKKNPLDYLRTTEEAGKAQDRVNHAVDARGRTRCMINPEPYFGDDEPPTNEDAQRLCRDCPIMVECLARMKLSIPIEGAGWMVAGGRVFNDGKIVPLRGGKND